MTQQERRIEVMIWIGVCGVIVILALLFLFGKDSPLAEPVWTTPLFQPHYHWTPTVVYSAP